VPPDLYRVFYRTYRQVLARVGPFHRRSARSTSAAPAVGGRGSALPGGQAEAVARRIAAA